MERAWVSTPAVILVFGVRLGEDLFLTCCFSKMFFQ